MTPERIDELSEHIGRFMGYTKVSPQMRRKPVNWNYTYWEPVDGNTVEKYPAREFTLGYHQTWNRIMPVIIKLATLGYPVNLYFSHTHTSAEVLKHSRTMRTPTTSRKKGEELFTAFKEVGEIIEQLMLGLPFITLDLSKVTHVEDFKIEGEMFPYEVHTEDPAGPLVYLKNFLGQKIGLHYTALLNHGKPLTEGELSKLTLWQ